MISDRLRRNAGAIALELIINFALPYLIYDRMAPHSGDLTALLASSAPPLLWSIYEFIKDRRIDAVSMLALGGIILSVLAMLGGGGAKALELREHLVTALIGLVFLGSIAVRRPLIYALARARAARQTPEELARFEGLREHERFRRIMTMMTLVWGTGLLAEAVIACGLVYLLPVPEYLIVSPVLSYGSMGALGLWTAWYARHSRQKAEAIRAS